MKQSSKTYHVYPNLGYWFLLFIPLVYAGFYHTYFLVFFDAKDTVIEIHFVLMALWIVMLITQPFLIKYKKLALHRSIGKISYVLVPLAWISTFMMMQFSYTTFTSRISLQLVNGAPQYTSAEVLQQGAINTALPFIYFIWMGLFYFLAIINRKRATVHSRYMLASSLTILGPTVDRILFINLKINKIFFGIPAETFSFFLADLILAFLLIKDYRQKRRTKTMWICLLVFIIVQSLYFIIPVTPMWERFITFIMNPGR